MSEPLSQAWRSPVVLPRPRDGVSRRGFLFYLVSAPSTAALAQDRVPAATPRRSTPYELPALPYSYSALEPYIDTRTMRLHHDRHHAAYVERLNQALARHPELWRRPPHELLRNLESVPAEVRTVVRNHGGGHVNHTLFWQIMKPRGGGPPTGPIASAINSTFGNFNAFKQAFNQAGEGHFGSGWVWLVRNRDGKLQIRTTPNQDSTWMDHSFPILGNDLWEHAYYLKYQNRRAEYLKAWWNLVNWPEINARLRQAGR